MQLCIKLNEGKTLQDTARKVQALNLVAAPLLVNGPIPCNPDSEIPEGFLGDVNTPPNDFGYVTISIAAYRKLVLSPELLGFVADTFQVVVGDPVEDLVQEDGTVVEVRSGGFV